MYVIREAQEHHRRVEMHFIIPSVYPCLELIKLVLQFSFFLVTETNLEFCRLSDRRLFILAYSLEDPLTDFRGRLSKELAICSTIN